MAYINQWFTPRHFLDLMETEENRNVILRQVITYIDENGIHEFTYDVVAKVLREVRGSVHNNWDPVCSLSQSGLRIAEEKDSGNYGFDAERKLWQEVGEWLQKHD